MRSFWPPRGGSPSHAVGGRSLDPAALPALLRASHLLGLALGSALGRLRESGATAARLFERAEESALLLRMMRESAAILIWGALGQGARAPSPALRARAALPDPAHQELPRPVATRDRGNVPGVERDDRKVGDGSDGR